MSQCAHGLRYLHDQNPGLVHGDIKGVSQTYTPKTLSNAPQANILIDSNGDARLADFGLMSITESHAIANTTKKGEQGSLRWMAPELLGSEAKKTRASDVYALAMTILEVRTLIILLSSSASNSQ